MKLSPRSSLICHPPCPDCGGRMVLSCIEPADPGYDKRSFTCTVCGLRDSITVKIESVATTSIARTVGDPSSHNAG